MFLSHELIDFLQNKFTGQQLTFAPTFFNMFLIIIIIIITVILSGMLVVCYLIDREKSGVTPTRLASTITKM